MYPAHVFLNRFGNLLLLLVGMESVCLLFSESFGLDFPMQAGIALALICVFLWVSFHFQRGIFIGLPVCLLVLFLFYRTRTEAFSESFQVLAERIVTVFTAHFDRSSSASTEENCPTALKALFTVLFLLSAFVSFSLSSTSFRISLSRLATLPVFLLCIIVNGTLPVLPTIGLLVCQTKDNVLDQYAVNSTSEPIGISEYELSELVPEDYKGTLPTIEEIENELKEIETSYSH